MFCWDLLSAPPLQYDFTLTWMYFNPNRNSFGWTWHVVSVLITFSFLFGLVCWKPWKTNAKDHEIVCWSSCWDAMMSTQVKNSKPWDMSSSKCKVNKACDVAWLAYAKAPCHAKKNRTVLFFFFTPPYTSPYASGFCILSVDIAPAPEIQS